MAVTDRTRSKPVPILLAKSVRILRVAAVSVSDAQGSLSGFDLLEI